MSSRNFRKVCGTSLPPPDSDSDGEYDPLSNRRNQKSTYEGLELSSDSESAPEVPADEEDDSDAAVGGATHSGARKKKTHKKKGNKGKKYLSATGSTSGGESGDLAVAGTSGSFGHASGNRQMRHSEPRVQNMNELDEIDKSIMEVNALLGAPPPAPEPKVQSKCEETNSVLAVQAKYLRVSTELKRLFGPDDPEEVRARNKTQPHRTRVLKRVLVCPTNETTIYDFKKSGLSMSIERRENGVTYFVYDHDQDHQKMHRAFLVKYAKNFMRQGSALFNMDEARKHMHVEPLLEIADTLFRMDENSLANEIVENVVAYLQFVAHPSFNLASMNVRLLYSYLENRPFHVAMLKYMYLLSNKACHRTALEIAKMLLNIDPSDPLAVIFVIDTLALRAREHQWLIDATEFFTKQRQANMLFNIQYSYALAHFHMAKKHKREMSEADKHLQGAIMSYPQVVVKILEYANTTESRITNHVLFTNEPRSNASEGLSELILIYAKMIWPRWREPQVMEWFLKNAIEVTENYNNSSDVRDRAMELAMLRHSIFQGWPEEISRHIAVIRSMANLLLETTLSAPGRPTPAWDPLFDRGINRYAYREPSDPERNLSQGGRALLYRFFTSILPNTELEPPVDD